MYCLWTARFGHISPRYVVLLLWIIKTAAGAHVKVNRVHCCSDRVCNACTVALKLQNAALNRRSVTNAGTSSAQRQTLTQKCDLDNGHSVTICFEIKVLTSPWVFPNWGCVIFSRYYRDLSDSTLRFYVRLRTQAMFSFHLLADDNMSGNFSFCCLLSWVEVNQLVLLVS